jgi:U32 family peptidase
VVFDAASWRSPEEAEEGGRIFQVARVEGKLELRFGNSALNAARIRRGDRIWRTHDPAIDRAAKPYLEAATPLRKQPVTVRVVAREGERLQTEWTVGGAQVQVQSAAPLGKAENRWLTEGYLKEQLGRLGSTAYELAALEVEVQGQPFAPASLLNQLRREAVEALQAAQGRTRERTVHFTKPQITASVPKTGFSGPLSLHVLARTPEQLTAAIEARPASITLDYLDLYGLKPSLERIGDAGLAPRVASPRVLKPGEERITDFLLSCNCPILVRSTGLLETLRTREHPALIGDFSLNAANQLTATELLHLGIARLTPTHDLNAAQVSELARRVGPANIEAIVYQHLPVFHTEHCVFCRFLSTGTSYRDCGRPCEEHRVALRDPAGRAHPVLADVGCRNTVFGAEAQQAANHLDEWREAGIREFRVEFAHESASQVTRVTRAFQDALTGRATARELAQELSRIAPQGVTEGSLFVPENYLTLPILQ